MLSRLVFGCRQVFHDGFERLFRSLERRGRFRVPEEKLPVISCSSAQERTAIRVLVREGKTYE